MGRDLREVIKNREARFHVAGPVVAAGVLAFLVLQDWWVRETGAQKPTAPDIAVSRPILLGVLAVSLVTLIAVMTREFFEGPLSLAVAALVGAAGSAQIVLLVVAVRSDLFAQGSNESALGMGAALCFLSMFAAMRRRAKVRNKG